MKTTLRILGTSDLHGYLFSHSYANNTKANLGISNVLPIIQKSREVFDNVLLLDNGDTIQGSPLTYFHNKYKNDNEPLDPNCSNLNLNKYSKNYINHLFNTNEILGSTLLTLHNINFYQELMSSIRENIKKGTFDKFHDEYIDKL